MLILGTLLHRAGITSFLLPRGVKKPPVPVGAFLLGGTGLVLGSCVQMIPAAYQRVWALWLLPVLLGFLRYDDPTAYCVPWD